MSKDTIETNEQLIVTYEGPNSEIKKYTTAYNEEQAKHYLMKCLERHGGESKARVVMGKQLFN